MKWSVRFVLFPLLVRSLLALLFLGPVPLSASARHAKRAVASAVPTDYLMRIKNHITWSRLPISVYFVRNTEYTPAREKAACAGFDCWVRATGGFICYQAQSSPEPAQITVTFEKENNDGHTTTRFNGPTIFNGRISMGVERGSKRDLQCIAAHEFGHALGIDGHSGDSGDLMYPIHRMGHAWSITRRDLNTLALAYRIDPDIAATWAPQQR